MISKCRKKIRCVCLVMSAVLVLSTCAACGSSKQDTESQTETAQTTIEASSEQTTKAAESTDKSTTSTDKTFNDKNSSTTAATSTDKTSNDKNNGSSTAGTGNQNSGNQSSGSSAGNSSTGTSASGSSTGTSSTGSSASGSSAGTSSSGSSASGSSSGSSSSGASSSSGYSDSDHSSGAESASQPSGGNNEGTSESTTQPEKATEAETTEPEQTEEETTEAAARFTYIHDPRNNAKAMSDIVENPDAVYGFSPDPNSTRLGVFASYDWTDAEFVETQKQERIEYEESLNSMWDIVYEMKANGSTTEEIARAVSEERNRLRLAVYENNPEGLAKAKQSNLETYGNENGPTPDYLYAKYGSWDTVLQKAFSMNIGADVCCGLYDENYSKYIELGLITE